MGKPEGVRPILTSLQIMGSRKEEFIKLTEI